MIRVTTQVSLGVLETTAPVVRRSRHVGIDRAALAEVAAGRRGLRFERPRWDREQHFVSSDPDETANYILVQDALNFCFWGDPPWRVEYRGQLLSGYRALTAALKRALDVGCPLLDASYLENLSLADLKFILRGEGRLALLEERLENLRQVGRVLGQQYGGRFTRMIEAAGRSAVRLVGMLAAEFPSFDDRATYEGQEVRFYKRAQLCVADLHGAFGGEGPGAFDDMDQLTACADYELPRVLRELGILRYATDLAARIDAGEPIPAGSPEEVEIRANTVWAVEHLREELGRSGVSLMSYELDWILWNHSQSHPPERPFHRTLTTFY